VQPSDIGTGKIDTGNIVVKRGAAVSCNLKPEGES
jgi:hypothetical protein